MDKLKWETVTYAIAELKPAGGVVTQRDVLEKYKTEHPDEEVKTFSGFKYDYQSKTVSLRIAITDNTPTYGGSLKSIAEDIERAKTIKSGETEENSIAADSGTVAKIEPELLQSERDELVALKEKYDALVEAVGLKNHVEIEDLVDLVEAKKAIAEDDAISLDEVESILIPTSDELADAAVKIAESKVTGKPLLAPREEITQEEAKNRYPKLPEKFEDGLSCSEDDPGE